MREQCIGYQLKESIFETQIDELKKSAALQKREISKKLQQNDQIKKAKMQDEESYENVKKDNLRLLKEICNLKSAGRHGQLEKQLLEQSDELNVAKAKIASLMTQPTITGSFVKVRPTTVQKQPRNMPNQAQHRPIPVQVSHRATPRPQTPVRITHPTPSATASE